MSPPTHGAEITLAWDDPNNPDQDVDHYIVYFWQPDWDFPGSVAAGRYLTHTLFDLNAGQDYEFAVTVTDADGRRESEYSNIVAATLPAASFSRSPANGVVPLPVTFTDLSTGTITSWLWDFGDGETSMEQSPVHTYTAPGAYTVRLTVSGSEGTDVFTVVDMITATDDTTSTTMHVTDLDGSSRGHGRTWTALVTITVQDAARVVTPGAEVYGTWSGAYAGSGRCTTDSNGQCTLASGDIRKNKSSTTFTVDGIAHGTLTYQPANNDDPDGDSDGVRITIVKP